MLTFVEFLADLDRSGQTIVIPREDVERLVARFGPRVRQMGLWHHDTDASLEVSVANVADAARAMGRSMLTEAVAQLKGAEGFSGMLDESSAAARLIAELGRLHSLRFEQKVRRYQDTNDPAEVQKLASEISQELFGA